MLENSIVANRLTKNLKKLKKWLQKENIEAYRVYDKDIPEFPYIIDIYKDYAVVFEKGKRIDNYPELAEKRMHHQDELIAAIEQVFSIPTQNIILKVRERQKGKDQYTQSGDKSETIIINEPPARFHINLYDYLDTGLFLDHRPMRKMIFEAAKDKKMLNLFCYTGSVSVMAAMGGAQVTSVDLSKTYIQWAKDNFQLNGIAPSRHTFISEDTLKYLKNCKERFDIIFLDPPSFSNSKKLDDVFDVQNDHEELVEFCMKHLNKEGTLYFSNNFRKFKLSPTLQNRFFIQDISFKTIPQDFRDKKIHTCYEIRFK